MLRIQCVLVFTTIYSSINHLLLVVNVYLINVRPDLLKPDV